MQDKTKREAYMRFCRENKAPVFFHAEWLDIVCGKGGWDAALALSGTEVNGVMPFAIHKKPLFRFIGMPPLTPYLGPWLFYPADQKPSSRFSYEVRLYKSLVAQLPRADKINLQFHHTINNGLPFYWSGFRLHERYTFLVEPQKKELLWDLLEGSIRRQIKKAEKQISVNRSDDIERFFTLNKATFQRKNKAMSYDIDLVQRLYKAGTESFECSLLMGDKDGKAVSGLFLVEDDHEVYYLMGGTLPEYLNTGTASLLMWQAILYAMGKKKIFNFEGSMYPSIAGFFKSFGACLTPYLRVQKTNSTFLKIIRNLK